MSRVAKSLFSAKTSLFEILLQRGDAVADDSAVGLDHTLTGTAARSRTAALPLEVGPQSRQSRQHVFVVGQLDLRLGIGRLSPRQKDVQNQPRAVQQPARKLLFDIARLRRAQLVVEDHHVDLLLLAVLDDLGQFARPHVDASRGLRQALREAFHGPDIGRLGQKLQLVEVFVGLARILIVSHHGHQYRPFTPVHSLHIVHPLLFRSGHLSLLFQNFPVQL